jgi:hypothetical protein
MSSKDQRSDSDRRKGDRRDEDTDRRQLSPGDIFGGDEINWSKLGLEKDRRTGGRRDVNEQRSIKNRREINKSIT